MRDVLSGVAKNGMGCFVPGCFVLHSYNPGLCTWGISLFFHELKLEYYKSGHLLAG